MLFIKIKQQDLSHDGKNVSDSIAYFTRVYMICLRSRVRTEVRPMENDSTRLYKNGDISVVIKCSLLKFGR